MSGSRCSVNLIHDKCCVDLIVMGQRRDRGYKIGLDGPETGQGGTQMGEPEMVWKES